MIINKTHTFNYTLVGNNIKVSRRFFSFNRVLEVEEKDLPVFLKLLVLKKGDIKLPLGEWGKDDCVIDVNHLELYVKSAYAPEKFVKALNKVSCFGFKYPDTNETGGFWVKNLVQPSGDSLVYSDNLRNFQSYDIVDSMYVGIKFLVKNFIFNTENTSIYQELVKYQITSTKSLVLQQFEKVLAANSNDLLGFVVPKANNYIPISQALWPMNDGDEFISLTAIPSLATCSLLQTNLDYQENKYIPQRSLAVGGTKPQNAGIFMNELGGTLKVIQNTVTVQDKDEYAVLRFRILNFNGLKKIPSQRILTFENDGIIQSHKQEEYFVNYVMRLMPEICLYALEFPNYAHSVAEHIKQSPNYKLLNTCFNASDKDSMYQAKVALYVKIREEFRWFIDTLPEANKYLKGSLSYYTDKLIALILDFLDQIVGAASCD